MDGIKPNALIAIGATEPIGVTAGASSSGGQIATEFDPVKEPPDTSAFSLASVVHNFFAQAMLQERAERASSTDWTFIKLLMWSDLVNPRTASF